MLLHGIAGSGKSTYSLIFATELASHGSILYGNFEEAQGPTLQNKINTIKQKYGDFNLKKIHFLEPNTEEEL
jgi:Holliday junction resolvasome RuvABC ATP-dependent DNA helicase subunit